MYIPIELLFLAVTVALLFVIYDNNNPS